LQDLSKIQAQRVLEEPLLLYQVLAQKGHHGCGVPSSPTLEGVGYAAWVIVRLVSSCEEGGRQAE